jgi:hypothetical protein
MDCCEAGMSSGLKRGITTKGRPKRDALSGDRLWSALQTHLQGVIQRNFYIGLPKKIILCQCFSDFLQQVAVDM